MKITDSNSLDNDALSLLDSGIPGSPQAGDIWTLRRDGKLLGIALLAYVHPSYLSVLPVTLDPSVACIGTFTIPSDQSPINCDLILWAAAPNSIGLHLLSHRIGNVCSETEVRNMVYVAEGEDFEVPFKMNRGDLSEQIFPEVEKIFNLFAGLADDEWVSKDAGDAFFDKDALADADIANPSKLGKLIGVPPGAAYRLIQGEKFPDVTQVAIVSDHANIPYDRLLKPAYGNLSNAISHPEFKESILELANSRNLDENKARNLLLQSSYTLAARQTGNSCEAEKARQKVINSLNLLLNEG